MPGGGSNELEHGPTIGALGVLFSQQGAALRAPVPEDSATLAFLRVRGHGIAARGAGLRRERSEGLSTVCAHRIAPLDRRSACRAGERAAVGDEYRAACRASVRIHLELLPTNRAKFALNQDRGGPLDRIDGHDGLRHLSGRGAFPALDRKGALAVGTAAHPGHAGRVEDLARGAFDVLGAFLDPAHADLADLYLDFRPGDHYSGAIVPVPARLAIGLPEEDQLTEELSED